MKPNVQTTAEFVKHTLMEAIDGVIADATDGMHEIISMSEMEDGAISLMLNTGLVRIDVRVVIDTTGNEV